MQINKGFAKAIEFEIKNTHIDWGKKGGEGHLDWTNKQKIVWEINAASRSGVMLPQGTWVVFAQ